MSDSIFPGNLTTQDVHIWQVNLDQPPPELDRLRLTLAPDEEARSRRYHFPHHANRFIAARGTLRQILSQYTASPPRQLQFTYSKKGKPTLVGHSLHFNLSHSHDLGLIAVSLNPVGIDLEYLRPTQVLPLAQRFFRPSEYEFLASCPQEQQLTTFFRFWTAKEAYLKGTGEGLTGLQHTELSLSDKAVNLIHPPVPWQLHPFTPAPNYLATLAVLPPCQSSPIVPSVIG